jgi:magnesium transporter
MTSRRFGRYLASRARRGPEWRPGSCGALITFREGSLDVRRRSQLRSIVPVGQHDDESHHEPGVVAARVYAGGRLVTDIAIEQAGAWSDRDGHVAWIGLHEPSKELLGRVAAQLHLHPLAIEDAINARQPPKVEQYDDAFFVVARTAQMTAEGIAFGETHIFVGRGYVVSVRHGASTSYKVVRNRCEASPGSLSQGEDYILYAILDFIVDNYRPVIDRIQAEVDVLEEEVVGKSRQHGQMDELYRLRRELLRLKRVVGPMVDVCKRLELADLIAVDNEMKPLFRDVLDHANRAEEDIDSLHQILAFVFEASMMAGQAQQNEVTRRFVAWAAILAVLTAIAGIYGMNSQHMPELQWQYGYYLVIAVIVSICGLLYVRFRRDGWL